MSEFKLFFLFSCFVAVGPPYIFYFGVKFYAEDPSKLKDETTRYTYSSVSFKLLLLLFLNLKPEFNFFFHN